MVVLCRQIGGRVWKIGTKFEQVGELAACWQQFDVHAQWLADRKLNRSIRYENFPVEMYGNGVRHIIMLEFSVKLPS